MKETIASGYHYLETNIYEKYEGYILLETKPIAILYRKRYEKRTSNRNKLAFRY